MNDGITKGYICWSINDDARMNSTSGAIFYEIAKKCVDKKGAVYGAVFNDAYEVEHKRGISIEEVKKMQGSKYSQSKLGDSFQSVQRDLQEGIKVLFSGTPCQVAGLKRYLGKEYENLICLDFICLGVPSPKIWKDYLHKFHQIDQINQITFKDKKFGWSKWTFLIKCRNKVFRQPGSINYYMQVYLRHLAIRPSCYSCPFRTIEHVSDLTVADCWGIQNISPELNDEKGISTVLVHTSRGEEHLAEIDNQVHRVNMSVEKLLSGNPYATKSIEINPLRREFFDIYKTKGVKAALKKYARRKNLIKLWIEEYKWHKLSLVERKKGCTHED